MNYYNPNFNQSQMPQNTQLNFNQFQQLAMNMPENVLSQLVLQAQMSGINQKDIESGLNYIKSLRNQTPYGG